MTFVFLVNLFIITAAYASGYPQCTCIMLGLIITHRNKITHLINQRVMNENKPCEGNALGYSIKK
ncbi:hypothetical protein OkiPb00232_03600 [Escherichia coli]